MIQKTSFFAFGQTLTDSGQNPSHEVVQYSKMKSAFISQKMLSCNEEDAYLRFIFQYKGTQFRRTDMPVEQLT